MRDALGTGATRRTGTLRRTSRVWRATATLAMPAAMAAAMALGPREGSAQVVWRDLVVTGGISAEGYRGNLSAVTVPAVDSTESASAAIGEFGFRGDVVFHSTERRQFGASFDGGLRQFAATGFRLRDYAPREWAGELHLRLTQAVSELGTLQVNGEFKGRRVDDRPPIPLFLQPGYGSVGGTARFVLRPIRGVSFDAGINGEYTDYGAPELTPQLDLLDRRSLGVEVGARWRAGDNSTMRFFTSFRGFRYPEQGSFDPEDPFRRDRSLQLGAMWVLQSTNLDVQLGLDGTLNRSNSNRPEYNALSGRAIVNAPLPWELDLNLFAVLTTKSYIHETEFARLVPGEEADNASVAYLSLGRPLMINLDGAVRFGWTRAEADIGDSYFQRFGVSFLLHYRP